MDKLLTPAEVGDIVGLKEATIRRRKNEIGYVDLGKSIMFKPQMVTKWIDNKSREPRVIKRYGRKM